MKENVIGEMISQTLTVQKISIVRCTGIDRLNVPELVFFNHFQKQEFEF